MHKGRHEQTHIERQSSTNRLSPLNTIFIMLHQTIIILVAFTSLALGLLHAVDSSTAVSQAIYATAKGEGFTKAIIRGYYEACGSGGLVDPNFVSSYRNARAAGITNIDTYWFPCTGASNSCKSYATQLQELGATFKANSMNITTLWIDIENDSTVCHNVSVEFLLTILTILCTMSSVELRYRRKSRRSQKDPCSNQGIWLQIWMVFESWRSA
jgi:hypothetical protein